MFYRFDADIDAKGGVGVWQTVVEAAGMGMLVLVALDVVRVYLGVTFVMKGRE
jgi:hypothetical protein